MVKIHILGGSGSGKTTLASDIAARLSIPHYELDTFGSKNGANDAAYIEDAFFIAEQSTWVTEGSYIIWTDPLLYHADYIVLLEVPWRVAAFRMISRHLSKSLRGVNPYPGFNGVKLLWKLVKDNRCHYLNKIPSHSPKAEFMGRYLEEHGDRIEPPDAALLLRRLETYRIIVPPTADFVHRYLEKYQHKVVLIRTNADRKRFLARIDELSLHNSSV